MTEQKVPFSVRLDIRQLAAIALYFEEQGLRVSGRSDLVAGAVSTLHDLIMQTGDVPMIDTTEQALDILRQYGIIWKHGDTGHKQVVAALQADERVMEAIHTTPAEASPEELAAKIDSILREKLSQIEGQ